MTLYNERKLSFHRISNREDVHLSTVWRWATRGVRGVVLESFRIGGRRFTTEEAFVRFTSALSSASARTANSLTAPPSIEANRNMRSFNEAERFLAEQGLD